MTGFGLITKSAAVTDAQFGICSTRILRIVYYSVLAFIVITSIFSNECGDAGVGFVHAELDVR